MSSRIHPVAKQPKEITQTHKKVNILLDKYFLNLRLNSKTDIKAIYEKIFMLLFTLPFSQQNYLRDTGKKKKKQQKCVLQRLHLGISMVNNSWIISKTSY